MELSSDYIWIIFVFINMGFIDVLVFFDLKRDQIFIKKISRNCTDYKLVSEQTKHRRPYAHALRSSSVFRKLFSAKA